MDPPMRCSSGGGQLVCLLTLLLLISAALSARGSAQRAESAPPAKGTLQATVTTQGTIPLGGVVVSVLREGRAIATGVTDADGTVHVDLDPGSYTAIVTSQIHPWNAKHGLLLGLVVAIIAPVGDLAESMVKRDIGVKDMGGVLPGHGGLLDRFDALLFVLPAVYYLAVYLRIG